MTTTSSSEPLEDNNGLERQASMPTSPMLSTASQDMFTKHDASIHIPFVRYTEAPVLRQEWME